MKVVIISLENGGYFNGFQGEYVISSPHPLNIQYFTYSDEWYKNEELDRVRDKLDRLGMRYKVK